MNKVTRRKRTWIAASALLIGLAGILMLVLLTRGSGTKSGLPVPEPVEEPESSGRAELAPGDLVITLTPEKIDNAGIRTEIVAAAPHQTGIQSAGGLRSTGAVQANEYKQTTVFPVAGGIVRQVNVELGDRVSRGQTLAVIFSTELADAQSNYLKMLADAEEHHQHYRRTVELAEIGAVSREDLEKTATNHKTAQANLASARQQLIFMGLTADQIDTLKASNQVSSLISTASPAAGTVIDRKVNPGEVVDKGKDLFRVADLSTVWVMAQIYENDFARVHIGTRAVITTPAYPGQTLSGQVSYIDPRVDPNTRTAQVRVEVKNAGQLLRLGMFVDVNFEAEVSSPSTGQAAVAAPASAIQNIGTKQVVYITGNEAGTFIQREVTAGPENNGVAPILSGLRAGDRIVTEGSFLLRAESLKLNPGQLTESSAGVGLPQTHQPAPAAAGPEPGGETEARIQRARVTLTKDGFVPDVIRVRKGAPLRLTFVRQVEVTCGTELLIPDYNIKRELPLNQAVVVEFTPSKSGETSFACGMQMLRGKIIVR